MDAIEQIIILQQEMNERLAHIEGLLKPKRELITFADAAPIIGMKTAKAVSDWIYRNNQGGGPKVETDGQKIIADTLQSALRWRRGHTRHAYVRGVVSGMRRAS